jgi:hypothetical protein
MKQDKCENCKKPISFAQWRRSGAILGLGLCKLCELNKKESMPNKFPPKMVSFERKQYETWKIENFKNE